MSLPIDFSTLCSIVDAEPLKRAESPEVRPLDEHHWGRRDVIVQEVRARSNTTGLTAAPVGGIAAGL